MPLSDLPTPLCSPALRPALGAPALLLLQDPGGAFPRGKGPQVWTCWKKRPVRRSVKGHCSSVSMVITRWEEEPPWDLQEAIRRGARSFCSARHVPPAGNGAPELGCAPCRTRLLSLRAPEIGSSERLCSWATWKLPGCFACVVSCGVRKRSYRRL